MDMTILRVSRAQLLPIREIDEAVVAISAAGLFAWLVNGIHRASQTPAKDVRAARLSRYRRDGPRVVIGSNR
jgi:hypothetical protein